MVKETRQPFNPSGKYVARKPFLYDAVQYASGDNFPWQEIGVDEKKLSKLYEARFILPDNGTVKKAPKVETPKVKVEKPKTELQLQKEAFKEEKRKAKESMKAEREAKKALKKQKVA